MTHCTSAKSAFSDAAMVGNATATTFESSMTSEETNAMTIRIIRCCLAVLTVTFKRVYLRKGLDYDRNTKRQVLHLEQTDVYASVQD
jgi:hypothetical protein